MLVSRNHETNTILYSFDDLLNSADLTNRILAITKWKDLKWKEIFQYKWSWWIASWKSISFNDAALWSLETDTRILSTWRWGESKSFNTIDKHTQEYAEYLSNRRKELNKVDLNEESYPIVSKLWFEFYNENEAKKLEKLLNNIKIDRWFSSSTENAQPYDIKYERKFFWEWEKLIFSTVNGNKIIVIEKLSDFPTVKQNKEKFLAYMNDKSNEMWWVNLDK